MKNNSLKLTCNTSSPLMALTLSTTIAILQSCSLTEASNTKSLTSTEAHQILLPSIPYKDYGACPFECCQYREWIAKHPTLIHSEMNDDSQVTFKVNKGDLVTGLTGVVITTKSGQAKILRPTIIDGDQAEKNEIIHLLTYLGEGGYVLWHKSHIVKSNVNMDNLEIVAEPESIWWVKVRNKIGQTGWSKQTDNFGNMDGCE